MEKNCTWQSLYGVTCNKISSDWLIGSLAHQLGGVANRLQSPQRIIVLNSSLKENFQPEGEKTQHISPVKNPLIELLR